MFAVSADMNEPRSSTAAAATTATAAASTSAIDRLQARLNPLDERLNRALELLSRHAGLERQERRAPPQRFAGGRPDRLIGPDVDLELRSLQRKLNSMAQEAGRLSSRRRLHPTFNEPSMTRLGAVGPDRAPHPDSIRMVDRADMVR